MFNALYYLLDKKDDYFFSWRIFFVNECSDRRVTFTQNLAGCWLGKAESLSGLKPPGES